MKRFIDIGKLIFPPQCYTGMALDPYVLREIVTYFQTGNIKKVLEFGSGASTEFLLSLRETYRLEFSLDSFDHHLEYCFSPKISYDNFNLRIRELVQYTDEEFSGMMKGDPVPVGTPLSQIHYENFRVKNTFYDIKEGDLEDCYDLVILDGPSGNGRSIAFKHLVGRVKSGSIIVIDDYHHYPFIEDCQGIMSIDIIKKENLPEFHPLHGYAIIGVK